MRPASSTRPHTKASSTASRNNPQERTIPSRGSPVRRKIPEAGTASPSGLVRWRRRRETLLLGPSHARALAERGVRERVQRLVEVAQLACHELEALAELLLPV